MNENNRPTKYTNEEKFAAFVLGKSEEWVNGCVAGFDQSIGTFKLQEQTQEFRDGHAFGTKALELFIFYGEEDDE